MSAPWIQQKVERNRSWAARIWQSSESTKVLSADANTLDQMLGAGLDPGVVNVSASDVSSSNKIFKHDRTTTVARVELAGRQMVLKRYNARSLGHVFSRSVRRSRASRCWQMSYAFARAGLNVASPALMLERRFGPFRFTAYFASEYLAGDELLSALPKLPADEQGEVLNQMNHAFDLMRAAKLTHGDLKASNLIWHQKKLYFIDLDAAQFHSSMLSWNASHKKDRLRFLKNWRDSPELVALFSPL